MLRVQALWYTCFRFPVQHGGMVDDRRAFRLLLTVSDVTNIYLGEVEYHIVFFPLLFPSSSSSSSPRRIE
jgi:hypothetical protein